MISPIPSHDEQQQQQNQQHQHQQQQQQQIQQQEEHFNAARANVGLLADGIWAPIGSKDSYQKLNQALWIRCCKIAANYTETPAVGVEPKKKRVSDVIPKSRLANYGDFEYGNDPEIFLLPPLHCNSDEDTDDGEDYYYQEKNKYKDYYKKKKIEEETQTSRDKISAVKKDCDTIKEPWMLGEVEEYMARLNAMFKTSRHREYESFFKCDGTLKDSQKMNSHATSNQEDTSGVFLNSANSYKNFNDAEKTLLEKYEPPPPPPRFNITNVSEAQLEGRIFNDAVRNIWRTNLNPSSTLRQNQQQQQQQQQQLTRGLRQCQNEIQRELGSMRPQQASKRISSNDIQQTHCSFQNERLRMPSRCSNQYSYVQTINMVHRPLAPALCVDVPEFFPKGPGVAWPTDESNKPQLQYYTTQVSSNDNPYQDELFPYKGHVANRKTVTVYQNTLVPMVPTPIVSAMVWPSQAWAGQRMLPTPIQIHQMPPPPTCPTIPTAPQPMVMTQPSPAPQVMCPTVVHRPIRIQESNKPTMQQQQQQQGPQSHKGPTQIPVYQRSSKTTQEHPQRRKNQGVDFNNLILLTKSAMKVRRNQTKGAKKSFIESAKLQNSTASAATKTDSGSTRWFEKGYQPKREREYVTVSTTISPISNLKNESGTKDYTIESTSSRETSTKASQSAVEEFTESETPSHKRLYRDVLERKSPIPMMPATSSSFTVTEDNSFEEFTESETPSHKRLYRDVLERKSPIPMMPATTSSSFTATEDNSFELRYDELERQAMEQYRTSEECLALRYQELEQQAMEQYRNAESSESININFENSVNYSRNDVEETSNNNNGAIVEDDVDYSENNNQAECSSGFGKCNILKKAHVAEEKGNSNSSNSNNSNNEIQQRIKILKADNNNKQSSSTTTITTTTSTTTTPVVHRAASEGNLRPIAVAKRLAAINGTAGTGYGRESKNTFRGASGEKIVKTSSLSSLKRRLMPMSPLERNKSGVSLMKNVSLDPMKAVQTLDKHVAAYYRNTKVIQTGSGDDKANNAGVWLSDFWS